MKTKNWLLLLGVGVLIFLPSFIGSLATVGLMEGEGGPNAVITWYWYVVLYVVGAYLGAAIIIASSAVLIFRLLSASFKKTRNK